MSSLGQFLRLQLAPPNYLSMPTAGIDISASAIKAVLVSEHPHGLELDYFVSKPLPGGTVSKGQITDPATVARLLSEIARTHKIQRANVSLPELRGYLFEADVETHEPREWCAAVEQHLDEYIPLPPAEVSFDVVPLATQGDKTHLIGVGYAKRVVQEQLAVFDEAHIDTRAFESEIFALPRALLPWGSTETVLIIDIGKSSTKLLFVSNFLPRLATTLDIGGHSLTLAVQKYFGVTEEEAKQVKAERGLIVGTGSDEYVAAMLSSVSVIREEILRRLDYWESRKASTALYEPVTRAILIGGNANVRGLPEYLESALKIPVETGDVFTNFTSRTNWLPPIDFNESLMYATAIGLALRRYEY